MSVSVDGWVIYNRDAPRAPVFVMVYFRRGGESVGAANYKRLRGPAGDKSERSSRMNLIDNLLVKIGLKSELSAQREKQRGALRVFLLDDDARRHEWFAQRFAKDDLDIAEDVGRATALLSEKIYDAIFLDHDLLPEHYNSDALDDERTGYAVAAWLAGRDDLQQASTIVVHTRNADGAMRMVEALRRGGRRADYVPFPLLSQRIKSYWKR